jgi:uncharacterized protein (DUF305 family)
MKLKLHFTIVSNISNITLVMGAIVLASMISACTQVSSKPKPNMTNMSGMSWMNHGQPGQMSHSAMDLGPADARYDLRFIDTMTVHHEGAILMANDAIQKAKHPELKALAESILKMQPLEINQMKEWRKTWYPAVLNAPIAWNPEMNHEMAMSLKQMKAMQMSMDLGAADAGYDVRFLDAMIPHHEGAVMMAKELLKHSTRPEMQTLAKAIVQSQQAEIDQMKQWRSAWTKN